MSSFAQCCDPGTEWQGTPSGKETKLGGLDAYVATPASDSPKKGILVITDIYSWKVKNVRLITDRLGQAGFVAVCPDYFHGDVLTKERASSPGFSTPEWIGQFPKEQVLSESEKILDDMKSVYGVSVIGAVGFCWGGFFSTLLNTKSLIKAAVVNHGSLLAYNKEVLDQIAQPILFQCSDNDTQIPTEFRHEIEEKLRALPFKQHCLLKFYPGQAHGWTLRGDDKNPSVQWAAEEAFQGALYFFQIHLKT